MPTYIQIAVDGELTNLSERLRKAIVGLTIACATEPDVQWVGPEDERDLFEFAIYNVYLQFGHPITKAAIRAALVKQYKGQDLTQLLQEVDLLDDLMVFPEAVCLPIG